MTWGHLARSNAPEIWFTLGTSSRHSPSCLRWRLPTTNLRQYRTTPARQSSIQQASPPSSVDYTVGAKLRKAASIVGSGTIPRDDAIEESLQICEHLAKALTRPIVPPKAHSKADQTPTANLLLLERNRAKSDTTNKPNQKQYTTSIIDEISKTAYGIIRDSNVFITPLLLSTYVHTQVTLKRPQSFPEVFNLYANKPRPQPGTNPIKYAQSNPKRVSSAVPFSIANSALTAAIEHKDLSLCLGIIDATVCTVAYKWNKAFRKALLPATGIALAPAAAYALATQLAQMQQNMDNQMATHMFFAGIVAYVGFTATIGIVAITTSNDQMDRITWAKGTPLSDRWLREDERALVDRVAGAWGFQNPNMRGEEEGSDWEALREWAGQRSMVLDNPDLMEGME